MSLENLLNNAKSLITAVERRHPSGSQKKNMLSIAFAIHKAGEEDGHYLEAMFTTANVEEKPRSLKYEWYFDRITEPTEAPTSIQGTRIHRRHFEDIPLEELKRMAECFVKIYEARS